MQKKSITLDKKNKLPSPLDLAEKNNLIPTSIVLEVEK